MHCPVLKNSIKVGTHQNIVFFIRMKFGVILGISEFEVVKSKQYIKKIVKKYC